MKLIVEKIGESIYTYRESDEHFQAIKRHTPRLHSSKLDDDCNILSYPDFHMVFDIVPEKAPVIQETTEPTYTATIAVGLREGYDGVLHGHSEIEAICQQYVGENGLCVTVTPTTFLYKHGQEPGCIIGLINYPRFPSKPSHIEAHAKALAKELKAKLGQLRVSIVFPDKTVMLGEK